MSEKQYSKALERCLEETQRDGEVVGLLTYALFKNSIREASKTPGAFIRKSSERHLTKSEVKVYKKSALDLLADYADKQHPQSERDAVTAIKALENKLTAYPPAIIKGFIVSICVLSAWVLLNLAFHGWSSLGLIKSILFPTT